MNKIRFRYYVASTDDFLTDEDEQKFLERLGVVGWELIQVVVTHDGILKYIFKQQYEV